MQPFFWKTKGLTLKQSLKTRTRFFSPENNGKRIVSQNIVIEPCFKNAKLLVSKPM